MQGRSLQAIFPPTIFLLGGGTGTAYRLRCAGTPDIGEVDA